MNPPVKTDEFDRDDHLGYRMALVEITVEKLEGKVDRLVWALVTLALSLAGSAIVFALTVAGLR